jgi:hypothetical protein
MGSTQVKAHRWLATALGVEAPFPWQLALLRHFLAGDIPTALDIPTGLGKTAVMAIWMAAKAAGAPLPRRLVYVVDRRAVVDQATKVAENLRAQIEQDQELKKSLKLRGSLPISTLRGKFADNREWLADPSSPAIILGTVDMVGSRLLFEGYGVSRKMRPFHGQRHVAHHRRISPCAAVCEADRVDRERQEPLRIGAGAFDWSSRAAVVGDRATEIRGFDSYVRRSSAP